MNSPLLQVKDLVMHFPLKSGLIGRNKSKVHAVNGVSFEIKHGETLGLVGESGCGKSTLGKTILRLNEPTAGSILFSGTDITRLPAHEMRRKRKEMQIIFQDPFSSLNPRMKIREILAEPLIIHGLAHSQDKMNENLREYLNIVGLDAGALDRFPHEFSGGQRQRIGIARALLLNPRFIVADEPVSALDVSVQSQILNLIQDLKAKFQLSLLFISHDLAVVEHVSDSVAVMYLGHIVEYAPAQKLYKAPAHPYTKALMEAIPVAEFRKDKRRRKVLQGDVPNPITPPSGCSFHPRCSLATDRCRKEMPQLLPHQNATEHKVACHNV